MAPHDERLPFYVSARLSDGTDIFVAYTPTARGWSCNSTWKPYNFAYLSRETRQDLAAWANSDFMSGAAMTNSREEALELLEASISTGRGKGLLLGPAHVPAREHAERVLLSCEGVL